MAAEVDFVNTTPLSVDLRYVNEEGNRRWFGTIGPFESYTHTTFQAVWLVRDHYSGVELGRFEAISPGGRFTITTQEVRTTVPRIPVKVTFQNRSRYTLTVNWVDAERREIPKVTLAPGESSQQEAFAGHPFRIRAAELGEAEVGFFIANRRIRQQCKLQVASRPGRKLPATTIELHNNTSLPLQLHWIDLQGNEQPQAALEAYSSLILPTFIGHRWAVRERVSGIPLAAAVGWGAPQTARVDTRQVRARPNGRQVQLVFENQAQFAVEVMAIDAHGSEASVHNLVPGQEAPPTRADSGIPYRIRQKNSGQEIALIIPNDDELQQYEIRPASLHSRTPTRLELHNRSSLDLQLFWCDFAGQEKFFAGLGPFKTLTQDTFASHPWVLRDRHSGVAVGATMALTEPVQVEFNGEGLQSLGGVIPVDVLFHNSTFLDLDLRWVDFGRDEHHYHTLAPGEVFRQSTFAGHPWRAYVESLDRPVGVFIPSGAPQQECEFRLDTFEGHPAVQVQFVNATPLVVEIYRMDERGQERLFRTLASQDSYLQGTFEAHRWVARDQHSGVFLTALKVPASPTQTVVIITGNDLTSPASDLPVNLRLTNTTPFTADLFRVDAAGMEIRVAALSPGEVIEPPDAAARQVWRLREPRSRREIGLFITGDAPDQSAEFELRSANSQTPTRLTFNNRMLLTVEVFWLDYAGDEQRMKVLPPGGSARFQTFLTHPWIVRDRASRKVIDWTFGDRQEAVVDLTEADILPQPSEVQARLVFTNRLPFGVDVYRLDQNGVEAWQAALLPGEQTPPLVSAPGHPWRARLHHSQQEVALFITGEELEQALDIQLKAIQSEVKTRIEFFNRSPLSLDLYRIDSDGNEVKVSTLPARQSQEVETFMTHPWVARDAHSGEALDFAIAAQEPGRVEIAAREARAPQGDQRVTVSFHNPLPFPVEGAAVDSDGRDGPRFELPSGATISKETAPGQPWRFYAPGVQEPLDLFIAGQGDGQAYPLKNSLVQTTRREGGRLWSGEVALFEDPNYEGRVWLLSASLPDLPALAGLGVDIPVRSIKVGPATSAALSDPEGVQGLFHLDTPDLEVSEFGNRRVFALRIGELVSAQTEGISSTSTLSEDFRMTAGELEKFITYRTILSFPPEVTAVEVFAAGQVTIEVQGRSNQIDRVRPARLEPNGAGKLMIRMAPEKLGVPALLIRTNTMEPDQRFLVFPDADVYRKVANLEPEALWNRFGGGGQSGVFTQRDYGQLQNAVQNLARTVPVASQAASHGGLKDLLVNADRMRYDTWALEFGGAGASFRPVQADEFRELKARAQEVGPESTVAQGLSLFGFEVEDLEKVIVEPVKQTVETGFREVDKGLGQAGKTLEGFAGEIGKGATGVWDQTQHWTEQAGREAGEFFGDTAGAIEEALDEFGEQVSEFTANVISVTLEFGRQAIRFAIDTVEKAGQMVEFLLEKAKIAWEDFTDWLKELFNWDDIIDTHNYLFDMIDGGFTRFETLFAGLHGQLSDLLQGVEAEILAAIDRQLDSLGVVRSTANVPLPELKFSEAFEKMNWLISQIPDTGGGGKSPVDLAVPKETLDAITACLRRLIERIEKNLANKKKIDGIVSQFLTAIKLFQSAVADPAHAVERLLGGVLSTLRAVFEIGLSLLKLVLDTLFELLNLALDLIHQALTGELPEIPFLSEFYQKLTGKPLSPLSLACLLLAIPITVIGKLTTGEVPFRAEIALAQGETEDRENRLKRDWAITGACMHFLLIPMSPALAVAGKKLPDSTSGRVKFSLISLVPVIIGLVGQIAGAPTGYPKTDEAGQLITQDALLFDPGNWDLAPDYWSAVIWHFQWLNFATGVINAGLGKIPGVDKVMDYVMPVLDSMIGIISLGLVSKLTDTDRARIRASALLLSGRADQQNQEEILKLKVRRDLLQENEGKKLDTRTLEQLAAARIAALEGNPEVKRGVIAAGIDDLWDVVGVDPQAADRPTDEALQNLAVDNVQPYVRRATSNLIDPIPAVFSFATIEALNKTTYYIPMVVQVTSDMITHAVEGSVNLTRASLGEV